MTEPTDTERALGIAPHANGVAESPARTFWKVLSMLALLAIVTVGVPYLLYSAAVAGIAASGFGWRGSVDNESFIVVLVFAWVPYFAILAGSITCTYFAFRKPRKAATASQPNGIDGGKVAG